MLKRARKHNYGVGHPPITIAIAAAETIHLCIKCDWIIACISIAFHARMTDIGAILCQLAVCKHTGTHQHIDSIDVYKCGKRAHL